MWETVTMPFGHAEIKDSYWRGEEVRLLLIEGAQESACFLSPELRREPVFPYAKTFTSLLPSLDPQARLLMLGGGAFTMPSYVISHYPAMQMDVVELYREVYEVALDYFFLAELYMDYDLKKTRRLRVFLEDASHYIRHCGDTYDLVYDDAYQGILPDGKLLTYEAAVAIKKLLKPGGIFAINFIGPLQGMKSMGPILSRALLSRLFVNVDLRQTEYRDPQDTGQNLLLLASDEALPETLVLSRGHYSSSAWED